MQKEELLKEIEEIISSYSESANSLYFGNFIKAYEADEGCQIIIIPLEELENVPSCLVSEEFVIKEKNNPNDQGCGFTRHVIFYKPDPDPLKEIKFIAHEIGHCILHWPKYKDPKYKDEKWENGPGNTIILKSDDNDEEEANYFASQLIINSLYQISCMRMRKMK